MLIEPQTAVLKKTCGCVWLKEKSVDSSMSSFLVLFVVKHCLIQSCLHPEFKLNGHALYRPKIKAQVSRSLSPWHIFGYFPLRKIPIAPSLLLLVLHKLPSLWSSFLLPFHLPWKALAKKWEKSRPWLCNCRLSTPGMISSPQIRGQLSSIGLTSYLLLFGEDLILPWSWSSQSWTLIFTCKMTSKMRWVNRARLMESYPPRLELVTFWEERVLSPYFG